MKRNIFHIGALMLMTIGITLSACMDDHDAPDVSNYKVTSEVSIGDTTITIHRLKEKYASVFSENNSFTMIEDNEIVEGVVVANDQGGNLYQTLVLAQVTDKGNIDVSEAIVLAVKNTCLYPYFAMGQMVRVNLKGLYVGCYSKLPKIGQPYYTSSNNLRLGPMLFELCKTNIYLVGKPSDYASKIKPIMIYDDAHELIKNAKSYQNYRNAPMLVTVTGKFVLGDDETILAPDELKDAGMGVDREFKIGSATITVRTSTQNDVAFLKMPKKEVQLTGVLSFYDGWQLQLRSVDDMQIVEIYD